MTRIPVIIALLVPALMRAQTPSSPYAPVSPYAIQSTPAAAPSATPAAAPAFYQFVNATGGAFRDEDISWTIDGRAWHTLAEAKSAPAGTNPQGRIGLRMHDKAGTYHEYVDYTQSDIGWFGRVSFVQDFTFPCTVELFAGDGTSEKVGVEESRTELFDAFRKEAPPEFLACVQGAQRIVSPRDADLNEHKRYGKYFDAYVQEVWDEFAKPKKTPGGWVGRITPEGQLVFTKPGRDDIVLAKKPLTREIVSGDGVMDQAPGFCAAFNRHVVADPGDWNNPETYYKTLPYNFYAKFWHDHSVGHKATAFRGDDYAQQDAQLYARAPVKVVITFYWDTPPSAPMPKQAPESRGVAAR